MHLKPDLMNKLPSLLWLCLLGLAVCSCGRRPLGPDQIERNRLFAEILERQDRRSLGEDDFFPMHLRDTSQPRVQEWCALALGRIGHPRALPWLRESLHSALAPLRAASAFAIGEIEDRELLRSEGRDPDAAAAAEIRALLDDPALDVAMRAAEALGKMGTESDAIAICRRLESISYDGTPAQRACMNLAITALMRLKNQAACPTLEKLAVWTDPEIQWRVANALYRMRAKRSRPVLERLLASPHPEVRAHAARALGVCEDSALAGVLEPLLQPRRGGIAVPLPVRVSALQALVSLRHPRSAAAIRDAIWAAPIGEADPGQLDQLNFAVQAAAALGSLGSQEDAETLARMTRKAGPVAHSAVIALAKLKRSEPDGFFSMVEASGFNSPAGLRAWAGALGELGGIRAQRELKRMLVRAAGDDAETGAGLAVPAILQALGRAQAPDLQEILPTYLTSGDAVIVRAAASLYQPPSGSAAPWKAIIQAGAGTGATDPETKVTLLNRLEPWLTAWEVQSFLYASLRDPERNARLAAGRLLKQAGGKTPEDPGAASTRIPKFTYGLLAAARQDRTMAIMDTTRGPIEIELFREDAPLAVANFVALAQQGFFNGHTFMRVVPFFVIQGGDPRDDQEGGPGYSIRCEINLRPYGRGAVGMALSGKDTGGSQFFITLSPQPHLDGGYTCFGRVISGMPAAEHIIAGDRILRVRIEEEVSLLDYRNY